MQEHNADRDAPTPTEHDSMVEAIRTNMMEMTAALGQLELDTIEIELPYRAAWPGGEETP